MYPLLPTPLPGLHGTFRPLQGNFRESASHRVAMANPPKGREKSAGVPSDRRLFTIRRVEVIRKVIPQKNRKSGVSNEARFGGSIRSRRNEVHPLVCRNDHRPQDEVVRNWMKKALSKMSGYYEVFCWIEE